VSADALATLPTDMSHPYFLLLGEASDPNVDRLNQLPERDQRQLTLLASILLHALLWAAQVRIYENQHCEG
jgi:hypothetical protein